MTDSLLVVNAGSSSLKFSAFAPANGQDPKLLFKGQIEGIGTHPRSAARDAEGAVMVDRKCDAGEVKEHHLAYELGPKGIRVHVISPGPLRPQAASGIGHFDELLEAAAARAPARQLDHRRCRHCDRGARRGRGPADHR